MDFCAKKQEALATGMTLMIAGLFGFVLLSFTAPAPAPGTPLAAVTIDGVTVSIAP